MREVRGVVDQWLPTMELKSAQSDAEVLDALLRQLGYPPVLADEVMAAFNNATRTVAEDTAVAVYETSVSDADSLIAPDYAMAVTVSAAHASASPAKQAGALAGSCTQSLGEPAPASCT